MKIIRIFFLFAFITCMNSILFASPKKIIILGDSLTEGYGVAQTAAFPALIQQKILKDKLNWELTSSGSSGSTSASGLQRIKWISKNKPDVVLLLLGSNDGLRGLKTSETEKNLNSTISWAKDQNIKIILGQLYMPPNYGKKYTDDFAKIYINVAQKNKIKLLSFLLEQIAGQPEFNLSDGIHPNEKGSQVIVRRILPFVEKLIGQIKAKPANAPTP